VNLNDSDSGLVHRCRAGDQSAWRELVGRHTRRVFAIAYRYLGRVEDAEDLTQEVFVKVYQGLDRYRERDGAFPAWLGTVARNHAIDRYRQRREELLRARDEPFLEQLPSRADGPYQALERSERVRLVHRGLQALPANIREPLVMCDLQGLAYEDIAEALGVPLGTVKSRINRGRVELAKRLLGRVRR